MTRHLCVLAALCLALALIAFPSPAAGAAQSTPDSHATLVRLYEEFRDHRVPEVSDGVPDYTRSAMSRKHEGLRALQARLAQIDTSGWSVSERVDHLVVEAEMNGMEFDHRVLRPWSRDPAFYVVFSFQFGPKMHGAANLPGPPLTEAQLARTRTHLRAIPDILAQARGNLTEPAADLTMLGIRSKNREEGILLEWMEALPAHHPDLVPDAERALAAIRDFRGWLESIEPGLTAPSGVGAEDFTWFMRHVMLLPYDHDELVTIAERDLDRALALMALEEHRNRDLPPFEPIDDEQTYIRRHTEAQRELLEFVEREQIMTIPDFITVDPPGGWSRGPERDYFANVNDRDPMALMPHDMFGHSPDAARRARDDRPIRGAPRLYFVDAHRQDGWSTAVEQIFMHLGSLDDRPRSRELGHNLLALRAVRALADLKMHSNEMSLMEAFRFNIENTPKGWLPEDSPTMWHDLELYLRQPGYGVGYLIGVAQMESLIARRAEQLGDDFELKTLMDDFFDAGLIPIALIHWELTGEDGELAYLTGS